MMGLIRKLWGAVVQVWMCLVQVFSWILRRPKKGLVNQTTPPDGRYGAEKTDKCDTGWDSWDSVEPFSVKVVSDDSHNGSHGDGEDLFKDMLPVIKKTRKIHSKSSTPQDTVNLKKFAVDASFPQVQSPELESWCEEGEGGWEEEAEVDLRQTRETLRVQRLEERERRKAEMEELRHQRIHDAGGHLGLGTRLQ